VIRHVNRQRSLQSSAALMAVHGTHNGCGVANVQQRDFSILQVRQRMIPRA